MSMFDPFKKLKLASAFLGVAEDPRADATLELGEVFGRLDLRSLGLDVSRTLELDGVRALYDSRYLPQPEPLDRLMDNGEGTLGYEVARYARAQKQTALVGPTAGFDIRDPAAYLALRVRMCHPIAHVLTEYDAGPLGELAMQSFYVGQLGNLISGVMISSALLAITRDMPDKLGDALAILAEAYQRGQAARPLLGIAWEELWSAQVPQLRELANLSPRTSTIARLDLDATAPAKPKAPERPAATTRLAGFILDDRPAPTPAASGGLNLGGASSSSPASSTAASNSGNTGAVDRPEPVRQRPVSQSSLLASFMALSEQENRASKAAEDVQEAEPELVDPSPARKPPPPPPRAPLFVPPPPVVQAPLPVRPAITLTPQPTPAPQPAPPPQPAPQPGFSVEEQDPKIQPALSPDDPDFF